MTTHDGLHFDESDDSAARAALREAANVTIDMTVNVGRARGFIADGVGRRLAGPGRLQLDDDPADLDEKLRQLRAQEVSLKLQRLLERAQRALEAQRLDTAFELVKEALAVNRTSVAAWLTKAQCHLALGEYEAAFAAIAVGRTHARDGRAVSVALALRTAAERQAQHALEGELVDLLAHDRLDEAVERVEQLLRHQPNNVELIHHHGAVLLMAGRTAEARSAAEDGLRKADEADADRFTILLAAIARREDLPRIEQARQALRHGKVRDALAHLEACAAAFADDKQFGALYSYALERARSSSLLARRRKRAAGTTPVDYPTLQRLIEWLVGEELEAGITALVNEDFDAAADRFRLAEKIDERCAAVSFLYGVALLRGLSRRFERDASPPDLDQAEATLWTVARLAGRAGSDPDVGRQSRDLGAAAEANLRALAEARLRIERSRTVATWVGQFNTLVRHYERSPIRTYEQLLMARRSFDDLDRKVAGARGFHEAGSVESRALTDLADALQRIRSQLARD